MDLQGGDGGPLVVVGQLGSLSRNTLQEIIGPGVHDAHGLEGDTGVGVDLLQHLVDGIGLLTRGLALHAVFGNSLSGLGSLSSNTTSRIMFSRKTLRTPRVSS